MHVGASLLLTLTVVVQSCCGIASDLIVHWYAPFYSGGGYSSEALSFAKIITNYNVTLKITQHGDSFNPTYVENMEVQDINLLRNIDASSEYRGEIAICHSEPGAWHAPYPKYHTRRCPPSTASYRIGRTMFETDRIPSGWADRLNMMDEIWVPTAFSASVFRQFGVDDRKIVVVEEPVDTEFYHPSNEESPSPSLGSLVTSFAPTTQIPFGSDDAFVYLFVGKWEHRKGVQLLLKAFFGVFAPATGRPQDSTTRDPNVLLVVVTSAYHSTSDFHREIRKYLHEEEILPSSAPPSELTKDSIAEKLLSRIVLLSDVPQSAMPALYNVADVLVIPSRGEGWGRPHVEAMACGTPVIATNWSGVTAYLSEANGYPLEVEQLVDARGWSGHKWAEPSGTHLQHLLWHVYINRHGEVKQKGTAARQTMVSRYSYSAFGPKVLREIERVEKKIIRERRDRKRRDAAGGRGEDL